MYELLNGNCLDVLKTLVAALRHGRRYVGIELNSKYLEMSRDRIEKERPLWGKLAARV